MSAIVSQEYRDDIERLARDRRVIAMLAEIPDDAVTDMDSISFMQAANAEYRRRGGGSTTHIGAIAFAMQLIEQRCAERLAEPDIYECWPCVCGRVIINSGGSHEQECEGS